MSVAYAMQPDCAHSCRGWSRAPERLWLSSHVPELDGVRGLAILAVVLHHWCVAPSQNWVMSLTYLLTEDSDEDGWALIYSLRSLDF